MIARQERKLLTETPAGRLLLAVHELAIDVDTDDEMLWRTQFVVPRDVRTVTYWLLRSNRC